VTKTLINGNLTTSIAPFRGFVQEREARGASGRSWLFLGERNFRTDFLYQTEWQRFLKDGALTRMDVAFSRDRLQKTYIQHKMQGHGRGLYLGSARLDGYRIAGRSSP
jgi:sulfite reductase (NADPH) flavoprotein alpha-component